MRNDKALVITSINGLTDAIRDFRAKVADWDIILVGDQKTPTVEHDGLVTFLSVEEQRSTLGRFAEVLPLNHYSRKNAGYLYAIREDYSVIAETDDDNFPQDGWDDWLDYSSIDRVSDTRFPNVYRFFTDQHVWPRGYPLDEIHEPRNCTLDSQDLSKARIGVVQGLVSAEPDVDAIYRLTIGDDVVFDERDPLLLDEEVYCPFNSQNTLWPAPKVWPYLYLPTTVSMRFTDILRGYVAQRGLWALDQHVSFIPASAYQHRNFHDLMADFRSEIPVYTQVKPVADLLDALSLGGNPTEDLMKIYQKLHETGIVEERELERVAAWNEELAEVSF